MKKQDYVLRSKSRISFRHSKAWRGIGSFADHEPMGCVRWVKGKPQACQKKKKSTKKKGRR